MSRVNSAPGVGTESVQNRSKTGQNATFLLRMKSVSPLTAMGTVTPKGLMENYDINRTGYHDTHDNMTNIDLDYGAAVVAIAIESVCRSATYEY
jgi:hypothetical protein